MTEVPAAAESATAPWRPPATGAAVTTAEDGEAGPDDLFEVAYCDERYRFAEGAWGRFGRDDATCEITIWNEIRDVSLSRVAGELWCTAGELWVRNLSSSHELVVRGSGRPQWLGRREPGQPGPACSIPAGALVAAPSTGSWTLEVRRLGSAAGFGSAPADDDPGATVRVDAIPWRLVTVAEALCAPLLGDGDAPATYDEIAQELGITRRQARRYVEQLVDHYRSLLPEKVLPNATEGDPAYLPLARLLVARGLVG